MKKILICIILLANLASFATHLRGGYISAKPISGTTYRITITMYVNTNPAETDVKFGGGTLIFGDGSIHLSPERNSTPFGNPSDFVGVVNYSIDHAYPGPGSYKISYSEVNRNANIMNMNNSVGTAFHTETLLSIDPLLGNIETPVLLNPPIFRAVAGNDLQLSFAASSAIDLHLSYELVTPLMALEGGSVLPVENYTIPGNAAINPFNSLLTWDTNFQSGYQSGEYTFAIKIKMWKKSGDEFRLVGFMTLDTQIILLHDETNYPSLTKNTELDANNRIYLPSNQSKTIKVFYQAVGNPANASISAFSELSDIPSAYNFTTYDSSTAPQIKVGVLTINSTLSLERENPYLINIRGEESGNFSIDMTFMLYTQDIQPEAIVTSTKEDEELIEVFPNPVVDDLTVKVSGDEPVWIHLLDSSGRLIADVCTTGTYTMSTQSLGSGLYVLKAGLKDRTQYFKILKR
jgi:hypothetical protein